MITANEFEYIKNIVFSRVEFQFDGEITTENFDGVKVDFDGVNAGIGCKDKATLARGLFLLALNSKDGAFSVQEKAAFERSGSTPYSPGVNFCPPGTKNPSSVSLILTPNFARTDRVICT